MFLPIISEIMTLQKLLCSPKASWFVKKTLMREAAKNIFQSLNTIYLLKDPYKKDDVSHMLFSFIK